MKGIVALLLLSIAACDVSAKPRFLLSDRDSICGYQSCHPTKDGVLNVHIVAHTHDDVGWLKTIDQLYYGSRSRIQKAGVQYIIDSVIDELLKDPKRKFVYVESFFFDKWWAEQSDQRRHHIKRLVSEGRLEFAGGAWSMNDEAATHYHSVVDQLTWGLRYLNDTFGKCGTPKAGWQIDPFGHSRELASLWAQAGFDGLLLGRVDYQDRRKRSRDKELEMIWRGSDDIGTPSDILTGIMYNTYFSPPGFCFDIMCNDEPFIDDTDSPDNNIDKLVSNFVDYIRAQAETSKTKNLIVTMGGDFHYQDALVWYKNLDKLIKYVNERSTEMHLLYSTPGCFIKSLHDTNSKWPTKQDDFFPYASDPHAYWTGYFTSRPTLKYYERRGNNLLQVCKQLYAMTNLEDRNKVDLNMLRSAMGIMQHHDAVTGTEKQHVTEDYARILEIGIRDCLNVSIEALNKLMSTKKNTVKVSEYESDTESFYMPMSYCKLNESECDVTEKNEKFVVTLYNSLAHEIDHYVRLPVNGKEYEIRDGTGAFMKYEVINYNEQDKKKLGASGELLFRALSIPGLGYKSFYVDNRPTGEEATSKNEDEDANSITNGHITLNVDENTGLVNKISITNGDDSISMPLKQELLYYLGMAGNNSNFDNRASGAYIFRPNGSTPLQITEKPEVKYFKGKYVQEIHQKFSNWASQVIRLYTGELHVEFEWLVGPIPIEDKMGKEVISRFTTPLRSNGAFYTDSNGRQLLKRIRNKRPTWELEIAEEVAGNYYPVTSMIGVVEEDSGTEMFLLNDRAQGGTSLKDGEIEIMVHRRLLHDDAFGVEEALNETVDGVGLVAKGTHYLVLGNNKSPLPPKPYSRVLALKVLLQPTAFFTPANSFPFTDWIKNKNTFSGVMTVPPNIHILTLEPWKDRSILLRLENFFQKDDYQIFKDVTVDLSKLLAGMKITSVRETLLAANQWRDEAQRLKWKASEYIMDDFNDRYGRTKRDTTEGKKNTKDSFQVTLRPMEIKTFVIHVEFMNNYKLTKH